MPAFGYYLVFRITGMLEAEGNGGLFLKWFFKDSYLLFNDTLTA